MRRNLNLTVLIILFSSIQYSCEKLLFDDTSKMTERRIEGIEFSHIRINDSFNIILKQDSIFRVDIKVPLELIEEISCYTDNDTLQLRDNNSKKWRVGYPTPTATIYFPIIDGLMVYSPANILTEDTITLHSLRVFSTSHIGTIQLQLNVQNLTLITGNTQNMGSYNLKGEAQNAYLWLRNACALNALDFKVSNARVVNNSTADCYVNVTNSLRVTLNSAGDVYYKGKPHELVIDDQSGSGNLHKIP